MTSTQVITPTRRAGTPAGGGYRLDIDGLRALAIALVVVYHVWFGRVSGGVDVFLMVSAYFMTASLVRRVSAAPSQRVVVGFWVHRFARLIPAAAAAIAGTLALAWAFMPASTWESLWSQAWASLFYVQNWELASTSVDYYSRDGVSPLQHFWSLSIQGQVFIVWPVLIVVVMRSALRHGWNVQRALAVLFGVIFVGSLTYSVVFTAEAQQAAYFNTFARLWEFAVGSLLALATPYVRLAAPVAAVLGWLGIVGLVSCGALLDVRGGFPGYLALWPLLSAAAVMIAGATPSAGGPRRLLESRLLQSLGRVAYPLYLVHWPILIVYLSAAGVTSVDAVIGSAIIGVSLVVAWLVARLIERPARAFAERSQRRGVAAIVVSILVVAVPLGAWQSTEDARASQQVDADQHPGAATLLPGAPPFVPDPSSGLVPLGSALGEEFAAIGEPCSADVAESVAGLVESCRVRESARPDGPRIAIVGDSHAGQWGGPLIPILESQDWSAVTLVRGGVLSRRTSRKCLDRSTALRGEPKRSTIFARSAPMSSS